ncbi:hypothetical protein [Variovorax sp. JS1663]|uniref:hypothetical protein n=1 Tax=Variovorax sp. JS1663 TaxID=1851577 RepID=UPI000B688A81|nr:hypothetical protein [Variovorax sp. JS1663]OUL97934.1 hypothetical protein A8M77_34280 [Variovorax sp. JS1663]
MTDIATTEQAYEVLGRAVNQFPASRAWDSAFGKFVVLNQMVSVQWGLMCDGAIDQKGASPPRVSIGDAMDAALFLRDDLLKTTGQRIWGLTFTLYPDGKFDIDYDYNRPAGYEETEETVDLSQALEDLQKQGIDVSKK